MNVCMTMNRPESYILKIANNIKWGILYTGASMCQMARVVTLG